MELTKKIKKMKGIFKQFIVQIPFIFAVVLLVSILKNIDFIVIFLERLKNNLAGAVSGGFLGSLMVGTPINGYVIVSSFSFWKEKIWVFATFLLTWMLIGIIQVPLEIKFFGKKFTILKNVLSFLLAIIAGGIVFLLCKFFGC